MFKKHAKHKINLSNNMRHSAVMYFIPERHKSLISFLFIPAYPVCSIKPLYKVIISIAKLFFWKSEYTSYKRKNMLKNQYLQGYSE